MGCVIYMLSVSLFKLTLFYKNYTSHAGIVAMLSMFKKLHSKHTRAVNYTGTTTTPVVDLSADVLYINTGMQPLLTFDH